MSIPSACSACFLAGRCASTPSYVGSTTVHYPMAYNTDFVPLPVYQAAYKTNAILNTAGLANPFYGIPAE